MRAVIILLLVCFLMGCERSPYNENYAIFDHVFLFPENNPMVEILATDNQPTEEYFWRKDIVIYAKDWWGRILAKDKYRIIKLKEAQCAQ